MPAPPSSPIDPALGHLVQLAAGASGGQPGLLAVLARVADPRHRRGVRHRLAGILGLALCAVRGRGAVVHRDRGMGCGCGRADPAGAGSQRARCPRSRRSGGPCSAWTPDAFDDLAGAWAQQATVPGPGRRRVDRGGRQDLTRLRPAAGTPAIICWLPSIMLTVPCWARWRWARRPTRSRCSPSCWTASTSPDAVVTADAMHAQRGHADLPGRARRALPAHRQAQPAWPARPARGPALAPGPGRP